MNPYVQAYLPLVDFLGECMGENTEIVLHDLTDYRKSVVAIANGHISGRKIGSPITDLCLKILKTAMFEKVSYLANYQSISKSGHMLKSSTYLIKDDEERFVGMLCINTDYYDLSEARKRLSELTAMLKIPSESDAVTENLSMSVQELVSNNILRACPDLERRVPSMQQRDKMEIVDKLNEMGTFMIKGSIGCVAEALHVSVPTIYRYLNLIRRENA